MSEQGRRYRGRGGGGACVLTVSNVNALASFPGLLPPRMTFDPALAN